MSEDSKVNETKKGRLPFWVLAPKDEKEARQNLKTFAYEECKEYIQAMADCGKKYGLKVFPNCNEQRDKMSECLLFYQLDTKYLDQEKDKIVQKKIRLYQEAKK